MKILLEGPNFENYYAKVHESFKNGLRALFDARCYGEGHLGYNQDIKSILEVKNLIFPNEEIDLVIFFDAVDPRHLDLGFSYEDVDKLKCKKAIWVNDFWGEVEPRRSEFIEFIEKHNIDYILTLFRAPFYLWKGTSLYDRLIWRPACFDPKIFNDWGESKEFDVGNLNAGMFKDNKFYPERYAFHQKLLEMNDIRYFYAPHPGAGMHLSGNNLIGKHFSEAINRCKIFITSGNLQYRNFIPKYVEIMASCSMLMANEPMDADLIGLIDGVNFVSINEDNIEDKVRYYLEHDDERMQIAKRGYMLAMEKYTSYAVAAKVYMDLAKKMYNWQ